WRQHAQGEATLESKDTRHFPTAQDAVDDSTLVQIPLPGTDRQPPDVTEYQPLASVIVASRTVRLRVVVVLRTAVPHAAVKSLVAFAVVDSVTESVGRQEAKAVGEPLRQFRLQGVIVR